MNGSQQRAYYAQNRGKKSDKRKRFVEEYAVDLNATKAAQRAGYSKKTAYAQGSRLLKDAEVQGDIKKQLERVAEDAELKAEDVIAGIYSTIRRCEGAGRAFQPFAVLKGYELLGKHLRMFADRLKLEGSVQLGQMTEEQQDARITELLKKLETTNERRKTRTDPAT